MIEEVADRMQDLFFCHLIYPFFLGTGKSEKPQRWKAGLATKCVAIQNNASIWPLPTESGFTQFGTSSRK